jgi:hypothetical protein
VTGGAIHLLRHQASGSPLILQRAGLGAILAEWLLYSDKCHCDGTAIAKSSACTFSKKKLLERVATRLDAWIGWREGVPNASTMRNPPLMPKNPDRDPIAWASFHG